MIVLLGVLLVVAGFALRFNPLLVVTVAGILSALLGGLSPLHVLEAFGTGFASSRSITIAFVVLPVIRCVCLRRSVLTAATGVLGRI